MVEELLQAIPAFEAAQAERCAGLGIDVSGFALSHVAVRCRTWRDYLRVRDALEQVAVANLENVWNGRPISKILLADPVPVSAGRTVPMIELIPPFHQRVYRMGLEHVGYVVGEQIDGFEKAHLGVLTGKQFQGTLNTPVYRLFPDYTHVKFYRRSLHDVCVLEGAEFAGFRHAEWSPTDPDAGPYEVG
ncbi:VOC family protein [Nocardioides silvaticus]|nr:VOC family protein [Nocardioides silvaticus]